MSKVEELLKDNKLAEKLSMAKLNDLLKKEEEDKKPSKAVIIFAIIGVLVAVAAAAYGIYRFFTPVLFRLISMMSMMMNSMMYFFEV